MDEVPRAEIEPETLLESLDVDAPVEARRRILELLCRESKADAGLFCKYGRFDGEFQVMNVETFGEGEAAEAVEALRDKEGIATVFWDPRNPPREIVDSFAARNVQLARRESPRDRRLREVVFKPGEIEHAANALLYSDDNFLGWVALYRTTSERFDRADIERLDELVEPVTEVLARTDRRERELIGERPAHLLFHPTEWMLEGATGNAAQWLTERRRHGLVKRIKALSGNGPLPLKSYLDGFRIWVRTLQGELGPKYLATVEQSDPTKLAPESVLTPRQCEVVEFAAAGATNREIAETLGISPDTVSDHLSEAYRRLEVANRVELALKLTGSD